MSQTNVYTQPTSGEGSIMHQTDASGNATSAAVPIPQQQQQQQQQQQKKGGSDIIYRIFCCFSGAETVGAPQNTKSRSPLLPPALPEDVNKKCLVLDLDETLVHSSFKEIPNPDFVIPVEIDGRVNRVYVLKRPGVDAFMERIGKIYEIVVFTASLSKYADPLLDLLDIHKVVKHRLFRESCTWHEGNYVKDLQIIGRPIEKTIIVDNSPMSYLFQPENAIGISSYIDDPADRELFYCLPFLENIQAVDNVIHHLHKYPGFILEQAKLDGH